MKPQIFAIAIGLLALSTLTVAEEEESKVASYQKGSADGEKNNKFFIASYQTTTFTDISTFVTTKNYFCALTLAAGAKACAGRRLRRRRKIDVEDKAIGSEVVLEDSQGERFDTSELPKGFNQKEKFFFTVWKTSTTTATITSTFTNTSITISASAYCTFPGYNVPLC